MLEPERFDRFFKLALHLRICKGGLCARVRGADQDICLYAGLLRCFGEVKVEIEVNLALCFYAACSRFCRTEPAEQDLGLQLAWEEGWPFRRIGRGYGGELCGGGGVGEVAAGVGEDGGEGGVREELREDVRALLSP